MRNFKSYIVGQLADSKESYIYGLDRSHEITWVYLIQRPFEFISIPLLLGNMERVNRRGFTFKSYLVSPKNTMFTLHRPRFYEVTHEQLEEIFDFSSFPLYKKEVQS